VVPDWHGKWPLAEHSEYCRLIQESSNELLLHGYFHQRRCGRGPISALTDRSDEMNGLDLEETRRTIESGQRIFADAFGSTARGFLAPSWQRGHVGRPKGRHYDSRSYLERGRPRGRHYDSRSAGLQAGLDYVLGFFSVQSSAGQEVPLATWSWDCGRWGWLGHVGHGLGWLLQSMNRGIPTLAIHPNDLRRGFWPKILRLTEHLIETGFEPTTPSRLLEDLRLRSGQANDAEVRT
jgi:hypothetical protein